MKIIDPQLLADVRRRPCCYCGRPGPSHAHHLIGKGMGGWGRLDVAVNVAPACAGCHAAHHDGTSPTFADFLRWTSARCGLTPDEAMIVLCELRRRNGTWTYEDGATGEGPLDDYGEGPGEGLPGRGIVARSERGDTRLPTDRVVVGEF